MDEGFLSLPEIRERWYRDMHESSENELKGGQK